MCRIALPREVRDEGLPLSSAVSPDLLVWAGGGSGSAANTRYGGAAR